MPDKIYKFTKRRHADGLVQSGQIRVGTLYWYTNSEHRGQILDAEEGKLNVLEIIESASGDSLPRHQYQMFNVSGNNFVQNSIGITNVQEVDHYIWCASTSSAWECAGDDSYDACVEINDPDGFLRTLDEVLRTRAAVHRGTFAPIEYKLRDQRYQGKEIGSAVWIKDPAWANQKEARIAWQPVQEGPIQYLDLEDQRLAKYSKIYAVR